MKLLEKIFDFLLFREGTTEDNSSEPIVTTGSIVFGALLRAAIIIFITLFVVIEYDYRGYWWISAFFVWFFAFYPAYRQYTKYNQRIESFSEDTLCGKCKHFEPSSQLCRITDEHVTQNYIPCEGLSWEPKSFDLDK